MQQNSLVRTLDILLVPAAVFAIIGITLGLCLFDASPARSARQKIVVVRAPAAQAAAVQPASHLLASTGNTCANQLMAANGGR
jgi:hypothetical protein